MYLRVFLLLLVKIRFVKVVVSYVLVIFIFREIKLKENGHAVGWTRLLLGLPESFS